MVSSRDAAVATIVALLVLTGVVLSSCSSGLAFDVIFDDAAGLSPGDPLVYRGLVIGEVVGARIGDGSKAVISVRVDDDYSDKLRTSATFCIEQTTLSTESNRQLRVEVWNQAAPLIREGEQLAGAHSGVSCWLQDAGGFVQQKFRLGELSISTVVVDPGTTSREFVLDRGLWIPTEWGLRNLLPREDRGWEYEEVRKAQSFQLRARMDATTPAQLSWDNSTVSFFREESFFAVEYEWQEDFQGGRFAIAAPAEGPDATGPGDAVFDLLCPLLPDPEDCAQIKSAWRSLWEPLARRISEERIVPLDRIPARITLTMPGTIDERWTNTQLIAGGTAAWEVTTADLDEGLVIHARSRRLRLDRIAIVAGATVLLAGTVTGIVVWRREHKHEPSQPDPFA